MARSFCLCLAATAIIGSGSGCGYPYFQWRGAPDNGVAPVSNRNSEALLPRDRKGQIENGSPVTKDYFRDF